MCRVGYPGEQPGQGLRMTKPAEGAALPGQLSVRRAWPQEAGQLTELAMKAKASWGYDEAFMAMCRAELTITPALVATWTIWVAEVAGEVAGMIALTSDGPSGELEDFMVDPIFQSRGVGAALMNVLLEECRRRGLQRIGLDADPNAEPIYRRFGFSTVGRTPSKSIPGRTLPRMERAV